MAIELIEFPKSQMEGDESPPVATASELWSGAAFSIVTTLVLMALIAPLVGPSVSDVFVKEAAAQSSPRVRAILSVIAWCARHGFVVCLWLAAANGLAYIGFAVSVVRIDQVMRGQPTSGLAHIDGGLLDYVARVMCALGGGLGGLMGLAAYSRLRFAYPYRYNRCGMALGGIILNVAVPCFWLVVIGYVIDPRPNYEEELLTRPYWLEIDPPFVAQGETDDAD